MGRTPVLTPEEPTESNEPYPNGEPSGSQPLVSCVMPTYNRRRFIPLAIRYFLRQDYPNRELIIVDDGTDEIRDLVPEDERLRYYRLDRKITLGAKLNMACELARGRIIAHWDDDDWYAPHRLSYQVRAILTNHTELCGINKLWYMDLRNGDAFRYVYPTDQRMWLLGSILCYTKDLWARNRFREIDVGMDGLFVWATPRERITLLADTEFAVFTIHDHNVSPKRPQGERWHRCSAEEIRRVLGPDWRFYAPDTVAEDAICHCDTTSCQSTNSASIRPVRNVYACLVHESEECVVDLVRNLRYHDPSSEIVLYNGSPDPSLLNGGFPFARYDVIVHPSARPMQWGKLHGFALDCMQFALDNLSFDTLTVVDSDQLALRSGLAHRLGAALFEQSDVGMLGNAPQPQSAATRVAPAARAWQEIDLWRPFLRQFPSGEDKFVQWTFWPSTVFTAAAVKDLTTLFAKDKVLQETLRRSNLWAVEEVVLPTVTALLGYRILRSPWSYDFVKYRATYAISQLDAALERDDVFWVHPVPRQYGHPIRRHVRDKFNHYAVNSWSARCEAPSEPDETFPPLLTLPILKAMSKVEGWLSEEEADLLITTTRSALSELPQPHAIVEIGSYCGRSTVVLGSVVKALSTGGKVFAIDPHDGHLGALDQGVLKVMSSLEKFRRNMESAGLQAVVETIRSRAVDVPWTRPVSLLFIDGLHDYCNVARDFYHLAPWVVSGGYIAFHDYADYYPGVKTFVDEIMGAGHHAPVRLVGSLYVVKKLQAKHSVLDATMVSVETAEARN